MLIFSENINLFRNKCLRLTKEILEQEMEIKVRRSRFLLSGYTYPIKVVVFEHPKHLGEFDYHTYQIRLNKQLIYQAKVSVLKDIIRHELAHLFCFLEFGPHVPAHGVEFRQICNRFGWNKLVSLSATNLEIHNAQYEGELKAEKIMSKIKKLLSLASSSNPHEAQLATVKANQLLLQYNLSELPSYNVSEEEVFNERVLERKRCDTKLKAIYEILGLFYVAPVLNYGKKVCFLEVTGTRGNVEIARYVAEFLDGEIERLWEQARKENGLKGTIAKNSFIRGLANGFVEKMQQEAQVLKSQHKKELMILKSNLKTAVAMVYGKTSGQYQDHRSSDQSATSLGKKAGSRLSINPGIKSESKGRLIEW